MPELFERNIALIGFMAAGKSLVGQALSRMSGLPFHDIDVLVEGVAGLRVQEIFARHGEAYFRGLESAVLRDLCRGGGQIIGCGGGTILMEENRLLLRARCDTVWLQVSEKGVLDRLERPGNPRRPLLEGRDAERVVAELMQARTPFYRDSDLAVETDGRGVEEIAREIALCLGLPLFGG